MIAYLGSSVCQSRNLTSLALSCVTCMNLGIGGFPCFCLHTCPWLSLRFLRVCWPGLPLQPPCAGLDHSFLFRFPGCFFATFIFAFVSRMSPHMCMLPHHLPLSWWPVMWRLAWMLFGICLLCHTVHGVGLLRTSSQFGLIVFCDLHHPFWLHSPPAFPGPESSPILDLWWIHHLPVSHPG